MLYLDKYFSYMLDNDRGNGEMVYIFNEDYIKLGKFKKSKIKCFYIIGLYDIIYWKVC